MRLPKHLSLMDSEITVQKGSLGSELRGCFNLDTDVLSLDNDPIMRSLEELEVYRHELLEAAAQKMGCRYHNREMVFVFTHEQFDLWVKATNPGMAALLRANGVKL